MLISCTDGSAESAAIVPPPMIEVVPGADHDVAAAASAQAVRVAEIIDGDTIEVDFGGHREIVRLIGIDTPETKHPTKPIGCFGPEASAQLAALLPPGSEVGLLRDAEARDHFDRLLAYVYRLSDGLFINKNLVTTGHADALDIAPNNTFAASLSVSASRARSSGLGLWGACPTG